METKPTGRVSAILGRPPSIVRPCRRPAIGMVLLVGGWIMWVAALPLPFCHLPAFSDPSMPGPGTVPGAFVVLATLGAFIPTVSVEFWVRLVGIGYFVAMLSTIIFPAARRHVQHGWVIMWALGICAGIFMPSIIILLKMVTDPGFTGLGMPVYALAHLFLCVGIWLLVPPLWPKEKFTHRLRRWLREL